MNVNLRQPQGTPLKKIELCGIAGLYCKDESANPTGTFKDRLAYAAVEPSLDELRQGRIPEPLTLASISYGNTAASLGHYANSANRIAGQRICTPLAFIPSWLDVRTRGKLEALDLTVIEINLDAKDADGNKHVYRSKELELIARKAGVVEGKFIDVTEGLPTPAYEPIIAEAITQLGAAPDFVVVPYGAGILCNEIRDYVRSNGHASRVVPVSVGSRHSIATMLYAANVWADSDCIASHGYGKTMQRFPDAKGRNREQYLIWGVTDEEIKSAMTTIGDRVSCEPSGAAGFAILPRLGELYGDFDPDRHAVLVINTGNSAKNNTETIHN